MHALILGGTREAREVATILVGSSLRVTTSLAGRVKDPALPVGEIRIGGFGGPAGLIDWLGHNNVDIIIDATHPFAETISRSAALAAQATGIKLIALHRPAWTPKPGDQWTMASSVEQAAAMCQGVGTKIFMTIGRQTLHHFAASDNDFLIRCVEAPSAPLPKYHEVLLSRGPFSVESEIALMKEHGIDILVTKNSGGKLTIAKLHAARSLGIEVIMIERPILPTTMHGVVHSATAAAELIFDITP